MKVIVVLFVTILTVLALENVTKAQPAPLGGMRVIYGPPKNHEHQRIFEQLKEIRFLDKLQEFVSEKLIGPHIDPGLAKEVFDKSWLPDAAIRVPRRPGSAQPK
jgi:hypothetical protein